VIRGQRPANSGLAVAGGVAAHPTSMKQGGKATDAGAP
jgi:hypothetical protein